MTEPRAIVKLDAATKMLADAVTLDEFAHIHAVALTAEQYARAERLGAEAEAHAREIRLRAGRRAGEILRAMLEHGERRAPSVARDGVVGDDTMPPTLADLGVTRDKASRWQRLALVPQDEFDRGVADGRGERAIAERRPPRERPRVVVEQRGKRTERYGPTIKQSLRGLQSVAVTIDALAANLDAEMFGDWALLYDIPDAQPHFDAIADALPTVSARLRRALKDRKREGEPNGVVAG